MDQETELAFVHYSLFGETLLCLFLITVSCSEFFTCHKMEILILATQLVISLFTKRGLWEDAN